MSVVKRKRVSKRTKAAWRKHTDTRDVDDFLEDQRLEERLGKFSAKADSELFVIDTGLVVEPKGKENEEAKPALSAKLRKRQKLSETPKCYEILLPTSKVSDPNAKRNHVNPVGSKPTALSKLTDARRDASGLYRRKLDMAKKNRQMAVDKRRRAKNSRQDFNLDLWGSELPEAKGIPETLQGEWLSKEARLMNVPVTRRLRQRPPAPARLARPAVLMPHPGVSYNPTYEEHQALLGAVAEHEKQLMRKEAHLARVTTAMFRRVAPDQKETEWLKEMMAGLPEVRPKTAGDPGSQPSQPESGSESDGEYRALNPPVRNKKKDHKARRKQRERLLEKEQLKRKKEDKKKITDMYKLRFLQGAIDRAEVRAASLRALRAEIRARRDATALPALNAQKLAPSEPDYSAPHLLAGNLRNITTAGNPLRERYEALQRRGAIAGARIQMKKKRKLKTYFKAGHKVTDADVAKYLRPSVTAAAK